MIDYLLALLVALQLMLTGPLPSQAPPEAPSLTGVASWYNYHPGQAAAGSELRAFLGPDWRGTTVDVCYKDHCIPVRLTDWCGCPGTRIIDLDKRDFAALAAPSKGLLDIRVR